MRVYGLSYRDTMSLPVRAFWNISGTVPRLIAGERRDTLELLVAAGHSQEGSVALFSRLEKCCPEPIKLTGRAIVQATSIADEGAVDTLRALAG